MVTKEDYDWPGWSLQDNPYGAEFDLAARKRMVAGGRLLLPVIQKYQVGRELLELGPFFNPLLTPDDFCGSNITFMDNDPFVVSYLQKKYPAAAVLVQDLNLPFAVRKEYDGIVASHLLNYIDFRGFLQHLPPVLKQDGCFFLNNSPDYGLSPFFSSKRPRSNEEVLEAVREVGLDVVEYQLVPSSHNVSQPCDRLLMVARKK